MSIYEAGFELGQVDLSINLDGKSVPDAVKNALTNVHFEMIEDRTADSTDSHAYLHNFSSEASSSLYDLLFQLQPFMNTGTALSYMEEVEQYSN